MDIADLRAATHARYLIQSADPAHGRRATLLWFELLCSHVFAMAVLTGSTTCSHRWRNSV